MNRGRAYYRHHRDRVIKRKKSICKKHYGFSYYSEDGMYSKGKIHCSCWMCSGKTKVHGSTISDLRDMERLDYDERLNTSVA